MLLPVAASATTTTSNSSKECRQQRDNWHSNNNNNNNSCDRQVGVAQHCKQSGNALSASCNHTSALAGNVRNGAAGDGHCARRWSSAKRRRRRKRRKSQCNSKSNTHTRQQHNEVENAGGSSNTNINKQTTATTATTILNTTNITKARRKCRRISRKTRANYNSCCMLPKVIATTGKATIANTAAIAATLNGKAVACRVTAATLKAQYIVQQQQQLQLQNRKQQKRQTQFQLATTLEHLTLRQKPTAIAKYCAHPQQNQQQQQQQQSRWQQLEQQLTLIKAKAQLYNITACGATTTLISKTAAAATTTTTTVTTTINTAATTTTTGCKNRFSSAAWSGNFLLLLVTLFTLSHALQISTAIVPPTNRNMQSAEVLLQQEYSNDSNISGTGVNAYRSKELLPLEVPMDVMNSSSDLAYSNSSSSSNNTFKSFSIIDGSTAEAATSELPTFDFGMPRNITARTGQTEAIIKCRVDRLDDKSVSWIRKRDLHILTVGTATYTSDKRFQVTESKDSREWTLHVKSPQARDSGIYECQVNTEPKVSMAFQLNIIEISPDSRAIISGPADLHFKVGSAIILNCHVQQPSVKDIGPIYWYRGEYIITPFDADAIAAASSGDVGATSGAAATTAGAVLQQQHDDIATNDITQDFTTRIAMESQLGDTLKSRLRISNAQTTDTGNYTCQPTTASSASVMVHVINDENPAAMQKSKANALSQSAVVVTVAAALTKMLTTITITTKMLNMRAMQTTVALAASAFRQLLHNLQHQHYLQQQQQQPKCSSYQKHLLIDIVVVTVVVAVAKLKIVAVVVAIAAIAIAIAVAAASQVVNMLVVALVVVAVVVVGFVVVGVGVFDVAAFNAVVPLSGCDVAAALLLLMLLSARHALRGNVLLTNSLALAIPLLFASRIIFR